MHPGAELTAFVETEFFSVYKWDISGLSSFDQNQPFMLFSVIDGEGTLRMNEGTYPLEKGAHFILPSGAGNFELEGNLSLIVSHP